MKKLYKQTPEVTHRGLLKKTKNSNVDYRTHISDILGNHYYPNETIHPVELEYEFEHQGDNVFKFTRLEKNSTGRGMSYKTLVNDYLSIPEEGEENKEDGKSSLGVHTMGETMAHIRLAGDDELYEKGFEVLTKRKQDDLYTYAVYDFGNKTWLTEPKGGTYEEVKEEYPHLPIDKIGDRGTYASYYINMTPWIETTIKAKQYSWFDNLIQYVENTFMNYLNDDKYRLNFTLSEKHVGNTILEGNVDIIKSIKLKGKILPYEKKPFKSTVHIGLQGKKKRPFNIVIGRRAMEGTDEYNRFEAKHPGRRALMANSFINKTEQLGYNPVVLFVDERDGYVHSRRKITGEDRLIIIVEVNGDPKSIDKNISTILDKSEASLLDGEGNVVSNTATTNALMGEARKFYKSNKKVDEKDLKNQFQDILTGKKYYHPTLLKELYADLKSPSGTVKELKEFYSKNITNEHTTRTGGKLDLYVKEDKHIIEMKLNTPTRDDFNQIGMYALVTDDVNHITLVAVSDPNKEGNENEPEDSTEGFGPELTSKYTTELTQASKVDVKFNLIDLRYYGLDDIID